jgi:RsiW-degrading membrane proteinase PrsW (M82 family)
MPHIRPRVITAIDAEKNASRSASTSSSGGNSPGKEDSYLAKIIKYIPGEAIATHQALAGFGASAYAAVVGWLSVALLIICVFWFYYGTKEKGEEPAWSQIILCPIAFAIWMLVVQSPAVQVLFGRQLVTPDLGSILLIFATAVMPLLEKIIDSILRRFM